MTKEKGSRSFKMTKIIKGDLILTKDTTFMESIIVEGHIKGYFDLKVLGDIDCWDIDCGNIDCGNIDCGNIDCGNIDCENINCLNIDCGNIDCGNIDCLNIDCRNINCGNINCGNIDCGNIDCGNIDCGNIILCDKIEVKKGCKVKAKALIKDRFNVKQKEFELEGNGK